MTHTATIKKSVRQQEALRPLAQSRLPANDTLDDLHHELEIRYGCAFAQWTMDRINRV